MPEVNAPLPALWGTEGQVAWATALRQRIIELAQAYEEWVLAKIDRNQRKGKLNYAARQQIALEVFRRKYAVILARDAAAYWISNYQEPPSLQGVGDYIAIRYGWLVLNGAVPDKPVLELPSKSKSKPKVPPEPPSPPPPPQPRYRIKSRTTSKALQDLSQREFFIQKGNSDTISDIR